MQPIKYRQQTTFQIIIRNLSVSSSRALPFTLPPHPLICQQTFRQTASQTISPPSFRTSSIHPPPPPAYSQIDEAELGKEKTRTERRTKTTRPKNALFSAVTMLACSSVVVIKAGADCSGALFVKNQGKSRVYGGEKDYETGQAPSNEKRDELLRDFGEGEGGRRTLSPICRGEWRERRASNSGSFIPLLGIIE